MDTKRKIIFAVLLALVFLLPFLSMKYFSVSTDELTHLPSGYSYLKTGEIKLNPQHPPFIKIWAALPLLFLKPAFDQNEPLIFGAKPNEWQFGKKFLFSNGNNAEQMLFWSRIMAILLSVFLAFYIFRWTTELFGNDAGLFALFLYALIPNIIAHAEFVTTDVGVTAFSAAFLYELWRLIKTGVKKHLWLSGIFLGLALGSKFSAVVLVPLAAVLVLAVVIPLKEKTDEKWRKFLKYTVPIFALAAFLVYTFYFFPSDLGFYKKGIDSVYADKMANFQFYLNGNFSSSGWWYYFPEAFALKNPVPLLVIFVLGFLFLKKLKTEKIDNLFLFLPLLVFSLFTVIFAYNLSVRYLIPVYPFLIINSGRVWLVFTRQNLTKKMLGPGTILLVILSAWYLFSAVKVFPDYLSYFNELAGGSQNGWKYLDDSNIDWGQDLKRLKNFIAQNPDALVVYPWLPGNEALQYYGIEPAKNLFYAKTNWWSEPKGIYAVSSHLLIRAQRVAAARKDETINWLKLYKPVSRIGQSFFIYEF